eukprot:1072147-Pleurochrysis_carterae.AAC.2
MKVALDRAQRFISKRSRASDIPSDAGRHPRAAEGEGAKGLAATQWLKRPHNADDKTQSRPAYKTSWETHGKS